MSAWNALRSSSEFAVLQSVSHDPPDRLSSTCEALEPAVQADSPILHQLYKCNGEVSRQSIICILAKVTISGGILPYPIILAFVVVLLIFLLLKAKARAD